jgi:hypothetical protein
VKEGNARAEGGGPAGVVEGILCVERRSGVESGSDGTANITMCWSDLSSSRVKQLAKIRKARPYGTYGFP